MYPYGLSRPGHLGEKHKEVILSKESYKEPNRRGFLTQKFVEFCKRTDLHGYKYFVMDDLSTVERSCWASAVVVSIIIAAYFVVTAYKWYARNPIVTVIETTQGAIWDVPFPAVTICDLNMVSRKAAEYFASNVSLPENKTKEFVFESLRLVPLLHSMYLASPEQKQQLQELQQILDYNDISVETLFRNVSPAYHCSDLVQKCMWKNTVYRCDHLFQQVFTLFNLCCSFNYYAVEPDKKDGNSRNYIMRKKTPRRVASCGYQTALTVLLNTNVDDYYSASVASQGALVFIDSAYNIPNHDSPARMVNPSTEVLVALSPERTYATSGLKSFSPEQRQCYYSDEITPADGGLVFTRYSLHNCMAYSEVKIIRDMCNCVPFYFPVKGHHRACNFNDMDCLENALKSVDGVVNETTDNFKCLPECEHFDYPIEVAMGKLADHVELKGLPFFYNVDMKNKSVLNVFFNDLVSTRYRRDVYLNWQNILAAFGGLLSLMIGFTMISGIDLLLFVALRVVYEYFSKHSRQVFPTKVTVKSSDEPVTARIGAKAKRKSEVPKIK